MAYQRPRFTAAKLRAETSVSVRWIAQRLVMGTRGHLALLLYLKGRTCAGPQQSNQPGPGRIHEGENKGAGTASSP